MLTDKVHRLLNTLDVALLKCSPLEFKAGLPKSNNLCSLFGQDTCPNINGGKQFRKESLIAICSSNSSQLNPNYWVCSALSSALIFVTLKCSVNSVVWTNFFALCVCGCTGFQLLLKTSLVLSYEQPPVLVDLKQCFPTPMSVLCMPLLLVKITSRAWITSILLFWVCFIHHRVSVCSGRCQNEAKSDGI